MKQTKQEHGMDGSSISWTEKLALEIRPFVRNPTSLASIRSVIRNWAKDHGLRGGEVARWPDPDRDFPPWPDGAGQSTELSLTEKYVLASACYDACWECFWRVGNKIDPWQNDDENAPAEQLCGNAWYGAVLSRFMDRLNPTVEAYVWTLPQKHEWFLKEAIDAVRDDLTPHS